MRTLKRRYSAMLGVLMGFGAGLMVACGGGPLEPGVDPPDKPIECPARTPAGGVIAGACASGKTRPGLPGGVPPDPQPECPATNEKPCMRYLNPIVGNPDTDLALRAKYITAFGSACYMSEANTFDCFYKKWKPACDDAVKIGSVSGNAAYDTGYTCQPVGNGDYTLQIGPDVANKLTIYLAEAPRQTPFIDENGTPTEVNGPYRNLTEPQKLGPGAPFGDNQRALILEVNRKNNGGKIHSDLAGFEYPCDGPSKPMCKEPLVLQDVFPNDPDAVQVHHVVRASDLRCCPWGTNSNTNAAVISRKLNRFVWYKYPTAAEVLQINQVTPYLP